MVLRIFVDGAYFIKYCVYNLIIYYIESYYEKVSIKKGSIEGSYCNIFIINPTFRIYVVVA